MRVSFRALTSDTPADPKHAYSYLWPLKEAPSTGMRVWVPGGDGTPATAVVAAVDGPVKRGQPTGDLKKVIRLVTQDEMNAAHAQSQADLEAWLNMARKAAGLPVRGRVRSAPPEGLQPIQPVDGDASPEQADSYGRMWWRAFKEAERRGRPAEEIARYRQIAHRWYAIRDRDRG